MRFIRHSMLIFIGAAMLLGAAGEAAAQAGRGTARIAGVVVDVEGNPVAGARVVIDFAAETGIRREETTGKKGDWAFIGLATGNWNLTVTADGYSPVSQTLYIRQLQVNPKVTVTMEKARAGTAGVIQDESTFELLEKGNALLKEERYDEAIAMFEAFIEQNPQAYQVRINIADAYKEKGDIEKAEEIYNEILVKAKDDQALGESMAAKALAGIGDCYLRRDNMEEAQAYFQKSLDTLPEDETLAYNVAEIFFAEQNIEQAEKYFLIASQIKPDWPDPWLKLGYVYLNKGDMEKAVEMFEKFLKLEPETERSALAQNILNAIRKRPAA
jgi:tetratricopeptide (TPR) repeat protein